MVRRRESAEKLDDDSDSVGEEKGSGATHTLLEQSKEASLDGERLI